MTPIELAQSLHALVGELDSAAEELLQAEFGVTHSQLSFLMPLLSHGSLDVTSLAAVNRVSIPAVSKRIEWFVDRRLVRAAHPQGDAKRVVLSLTPQGNRLAREASTRLANRLDDLLVSWPDSRRTVLHELVRDLTEAIQHERDDAVKESA
jgi:DNA-binding MarR family transcriptional regulator